MGESRLMLSHSYEAYVVVVEVKRLNPPQILMWRGKRENWSDLLLDEIGKTWWWLWSVENQWRAGE